MAQSKPLSQRMPWLDRAGRLSPMKSAALLLLAMPALWLLYRTLFLDLGPRPYIEAIHRLGDWTVYLLLITLAVSPARRLFDWSKLIQLRRMIGVAALAYVLGHFILYIFDSKWNLVFVAQEIVLRIYLAIGFVAILALALLGATSTDSAIRRLGSRWQSLHKLVYPATALAILHYYMQSKVDVSQPVIMTGFFYWLMGYRLMAARGLKEGLSPLVALTVGVTALTVLTEALWYQLMTGVGGQRVLLANLEFGFRISPAWYVLASGLAVTVASELRLRLSAPKMRRRTSTA